MICPACQGPTRINKTLDTGDVVTRMHECLDPVCDEIWTTDQKLRLGSRRKNRRNTQRREAISNHGQPLAAISVAVQPLETAGEGSTDANGQKSVGGFRGSVSSPVSSTLVLGSSPDLLSNPDQEETRARGTEYPAEFERAWSATHRTGSKFKAHEAWRKHGKPSLDVVAASWRAWSRTDGWQRGFVPHVATWLNGRCFEQEPAEVVARATVPEKVQQSRDAWREVLNERKASQ